MWGRNSFRHTLNLDFARVIDRRNVIYPTASIETSSELTEAVDPPQNSREALFAAISRGDTRFVTNLINKQGNGYLVHVKNEAGETPLLAAVAQHQVAIVNALLNKNKEDGFWKSNLWARTTNGDTALHLACRRSRDLEEMSRFSHRPIPQLDIIRALLAAGADVDVVNNAGETPLHLATHKNSYKYDVLIERNANTKVKDSRGWTPLHCAAHNGNNNAMTALVNAGADIEATNKDGHTPLQLAKSDFLKGIIAAKNERDERDRRYAQRRRAEAERITNAVAERERLEVAARRTPYRQPILAAFVSGLIAIGVALTDAYIGLGLLAQIGFAASVPLFASIGFIVTMAVFTALRARERLFARCAANIENRFTPLNVQEQEAYVLGQTIAYDWPVYIQSFRHLHAWQNYRTVGAGMHRALNPRPVLEENVGQDRRIFGP